jgi:hypothetical protein
MPALIKALRTFSSCAASIGGFAVELDEGAAVPTVNEYALPEFAREMRHEKLLDVLTGVKRGPDG